MMDAADALSLIVAVATLMAGGWLVRDSWYRLRQDRLDYSEALLNDDEARQRYASRVERVRQLHAALARAEEQGLAQVVPPVGQESGVAVATAERALAELDAELDRLGAEQNTVEQRLAHEDESRRRAVLRLCHRIRWLDRGFLALGVALASGSAVAIVVLLLAHTNLATG